MTERPPTFLAALDLRERTCLVVGTGAEAVRRATSLATCGARVTVLANSPCSVLSALTEAGRIELVARDFQESDLDGCWLAVLCERNPELALRLSQAAEERRVFFCAIDQPAYNSFAHVAEERVGGVAVAVSTEGRAPALARRLAELFGAALRAADIGAFVAELELLRRQAPEGKRRALMLQAVSTLRFEGRLLWGEP
jgi:siroheme synthase-like protein